MPSSDTKVICLISSRDRLLKYRAHPTFQRSKRSWIETPVSPFEKAWSLMEKLNNSRIVYLPSWLRGRKYLHRKQTRNPQRFESSTRLQSMPECRNIRRSGLSPVSVNPKFMDDPILWFGVLVLNPASRHQFQNRVNRHRVYDSCGWTPWRTTRFWNYIDLYYRNDIHQYKLV